MGWPNLAETICECTRDLLTTQNGIVMAQNCSKTATGILFKTFPDDLANHPGLVTLPNSDSMNPAVAVGAALAGRPTMYVVRFGGFLQLNAWALTGYAAIANEMWGYEIPLLIRVCSGEGNLGPVASGPHHSIFGHYPGIEVVYPTTPNEWIHCWNWWLHKKCPVVFSECRASYKNVYDDLHVYHPNAVASIVAIGGARPNARTAAKNLTDAGHPTNYIPTTGPWRSLDRASGIPAVVVDWDYPQCGLASTIALELAQRGCRVSAIGLADRVAGFSAHDNISQSVDRITDEVRKLCSW